MKENLLITFFLCIFAKWIDGSREPLTRVIQQPFHFAYLLESLSVGNKMKRLTTQEFIDRAKKVHGDKYDYSKVEYKTSYSKVEIVCPIHGSFYQIPKHHMNGSGCPMCDKSKKLNTKEFIKKAQAVHGNKYNYDKSNYIRAFEKICITCPVHGDFWQLPAVHLQGHGCALCKNEATRKRCVMSKDEFIRRAKIAHPTKNYDYSKVEYLTSDDKVCIICPEHGEFWQKAHNHLNGSCCPNCQVSFGENLVKVFLDEHHIDYIPQYRIKNENLFCNNEYLIVDFYLPSFNAIIEYNGVQHYQPIKRFGGYGSFDNQIERDNSLRQYCKEHKIKLIEIPYTQKKNINEILKKELKTK
jgi:hypothetical protein